jgi:multiple sugar transport system substrate-binding protein
MFVAGRVAMHWDGNYIIPALREIKNFQWDVACLPKGKRRASSMGGICAAVTAQSKHPQASWELVKYIAGSKSQAILIKTGWPIPSLKDKKLIAEFLSNTPPDNRQVFLDTLDYSRSMPKAPNWSEIKDVLQREIDFALLGKKSPSEALRSAASQADKLLKSEEKK